MTTNILPPIEDKPRGCYNCGEAESACKCPAEEPVDLDAWRAEAGAALAMANAATPGWTDKAGYNNAGIPTRFLAVPGANDGSEVEMIAEDARYAVAARTGWPRDAARVGVLADRCEALQAALSEALDVAESLLSVATTYCCMTSDSAKIDRLRALAAGGAPKGESR